MNPTLAVRLRVHALNHCAIYENTNRNCLLAVTSSLEEESAISVRCPHVLCCGSSWVQGVMQLVESFGCWLRITGCSFEPRGQASVWGCGMRREMDLNMSALYSSLGSCRTPPTMALMTLRSKFPETHISILRRLKPSQWLLHSISKCRLAFQADMMLMPFSFPSMQKEHWEDPGGFVVTWGYDLSKRLY